MANNFPEGIARTVMFLEDGIKRSEENSVRYGTSAAEDEQRFIQLIKDCAHMFGGDLTDQQWWAGIATVISVLATWSEQSVFGSLVEGVVAAFVTGAGRLHDDLVKEGVVVFDGK